MLFTSKLLFYYRILSYSYSTAVFSEDYFSASFPLIGLKIVHSDLLVVRQSAIYLFSSDRTNSKRVLWDQMLKESHRQLLYLENGASEVKKK